MASLVENSQSQEVVLSSESVGNDAASDASSEAPSSEYEIFNKNTVKRLVALAGIARVGSDVTEVVNKVSLDWVDSVLSKAIVFLKFSKHKTFNVSDFAFLSNRYPMTMTPFVAPNRVIVKPCKKDADLEKVLKGKLQGVVFTAKRTFDNFIHKRFKYLQEQTYKNPDENPNFRLGTSENNNAVSIMQLMVDEYITQVLLKSRSYMDSRDTLYGSDILSAAASSF